MDQILHPIIVAFAWIWVRLHDLLVLLGVPDGSGIGWILSIVVLTVIVRFVVLPLYIKQMKSMRMMQMIQPELKKLQEKYKGKTDQVSRQRQSEEMMALYRKSGFSPYASCWPMLIQLPFVFALYRTIYAVEQIRNGTYSYSSLGPLDVTIAEQINNSSFFGVNLNETFSSVSGFADKSVFIVFTIIMVLVQYFSMLISVKRNTPKQADPTNPMVKSQKLMLYILPLMFVFTGLVLQVGVMVYTLTTVVFAFVQQVAIIKIMPNPNSPAYFVLRDQLQTKYQAWAVPFFDNFKEEKQRISTQGEEALEQFYAKTLATVQSKARKQKVSKKFPEDWAARDQLDIYQNLAYDSWSQIPDDTWLTSVARVKKREAEQAQAKRRQARHLSREERMKQRQKKQSQQQADLRRQERQDKAKANARGKELTPEEVERRRQERQKQRREAAKKNQNRKSK